MTYTVSGRTLNPTHSLTPSISRLFFSLISGPTHSMFLLTWSY